MKILVVNSGSSSLKYTVFAMEDEQVLLEGVVDRIGMEDATHTVFQGAGEPEKNRLAVRNHGAAFDLMLDTLLHKTVGSLDEIQAVAHRVAHGGRFRQTVEMSDEVMDEVRRMTPFIPLHHPAMIEGIRECMQRMPGARHCAVFDTSFHHTIPDTAAIYGLPYHYFSERGYRRTGFHGSSHAYVSAKAAQFVGRPISDLRIITCHLGNGASLCAVDRGHSIDTTLGMSAVPGLIMGTRSGDVDPGLLLVIMKEDNLTADRMLEILYRESGLKGISGLSRDMRDIEREAEKGNPRATLALEAFCYQVKRAMGSMLIVLGGCDVLAFCGGIGRNSPTVREKSLENCEGLGFALDPEKNRSAGPDAGNPVADISGPGSRSTILVIRTFEELMMARECARVLGTG